MNFQTKRILEQLGYLLKLCEDAGEKIGDKRVSIAKEQTLGWKERLLAEPTGVYKDHILNTIEPGVTNARIEATNNKINI